MHPSQTFIFVPAWAIVITVCLLSMANPAHPQDHKTPDQLKGKHVAILVADGFEESELVEPRKALMAAGAKTTIVSPQPGQVKAWKDGNWSLKYDVDLGLDGAKAADFDALLLPGGVINPDKLRINARAIGFIKEFATMRKPIAAICHGPWPLIDAEIVRSRRMTSWPSLRMDIKNAGGLWEDAEVVVDQRLVTSRKPEDIPAFNRKMIEEFAKARTFAGQ